MEFSCYLFSFWGSMQDVLDDQGGATMRLSSSHKSKCRREGERVYDFRKHRVELPQITELDSTWYINGKMEAAQHLDNLHRI